MVLGLFSSSKKKGAKKAATKKAVRAKGKLKKKAGTCEFC